MWTWISVSSYTWKILWVSCSWVPWATCRFWHFGDVLYQSGEDSFTVRWRRMVTEIVFNIMAILGGKKPKKQYKFLWNCLLMLLGHRSFYSLMHCRHPQIQMMTTDHRLLRPEKSLQRTWMVISHCKNMCFISSKFQNLMNTSVSLMMIISVLDGGVKRGRKWLTSLV